MLSVDYTAGCHYDDYGTDDCAVADASDPTYPGHTGLDFINCAGKNVYSVAVGKVVAVGAVDDGEFRTWVWVRHSDYTHTRIIDSIYAHITPAAGIVAGVDVTENTLLGTVTTYSATTASWTGPHLHLSIVVHDVANADNGWELGELADYDSDVYVWYTGHAVNPLDYIICDKFCCEDDIISIAAAPPPAQNPPLASVPLPGWRPFPRKPFGGAAYSLVEGNHGGWPSWLAGAYLSSGTSSVYPFLDSPTGKIRVAGVSTGTYYTVWLWHHDRLVTWYRWFGNSKTMAVMQGEWIDQGTVLGTVTKGAGSALVEWGVYMRAADDDPFDPDVNPEDEYWCDSLHPACFLWPESGWVDWPLAEYSDPAEWYDDCTGTFRICLGYGLGGLA